MFMVCQSSCISPTKLAKLEPGIWISIEGGYDADFSPDGNSLVYTESVKGMNWKEDIILYSLQTGQKTRLSSNVFWDGEARWQPGGEHIVYTTETVGHKTLFLYSVKDGSTVELSESEAYHPCWSPTGRQLVFVNSSSRFAELWLYDLDTQVYRQLTDFEKEVATPAWSPDNSKIVFCLKTDDQWDLWQITLPEFEPQLLFKTIQNECYPRWSSSGRYLAFCSFVPDAKANVRQCKIWIATREGQTFPAKVSLLLEAKESGQKFFYPSFSPDDKFLVFSTNQSQYRWDLGFVDLDKRLEQAAPQ
ncbi:PD40 domain-containing protein [bacterium]|nr:PD40 domain-containing protein [bacterium]